MWEAIKESRNTRYIIQVMRSVGLNVLMKQCCVGYRMYVKRGQMTKNVTKMAALIVDLMP